MSRTDLEQKVFEAVSCDMAICFEATAEEIREEIKSASDEDLLKYLDI